jgi:hypothetical protein
MTPTSTPTWIDLRAEQLAHHAGFPDVPNLLHARGPGQETEGATFLYQVAYTLAEQLDANDREAPDVPSRAEYLEDLPHLIGGNVVDNLDAQDLLLAYAFLDARHVPDEATAEDEWPTLEAWVVETDAEESGVLVMSLVKRKLTQIATTLAAALLAIDAGTDWEAEVTA